MKNIPFVLFLLFSIKTLAQQEAEPLDSTYLLRTLTMEKDTAKAKGIADRYIDCLRQPITKQNIRLFLPFVNNESDKGFHLFVENAAQINKLMGQNGFVETSIVRIIFKDEVEPLLLDENITSIDLKNIFSKTDRKYPTLEKNILTPGLESCFQNYLANEIYVMTKLKVMRKQDWVNIYNKLNHRYKSYDCLKTLLEEKILYYSGRKQWSLCSNAAISLISRYKTQLGYNVINDICWNCIFLHTNNKVVLNRALVYMDEVVKNTPSNCANLDTYANLLYKAGYNKEAVLWEKKAINISIQNHLGYENDFTKTIYKIKTRQKTWGGITGSYNFTVIF